MNTEILADAMEVCPRASLGHPDGNLPAAAVDDIARSLNVLLADMFALYVKTKNFHWHVSGPALPGLPPSAG